MTDTAHTTEHLANERTFLAWVRSSVAFIGVGFVIARFGVLTGYVPKETLGLGLAVVGVGALLSLQAALEYKRTFTAIETGLFQPRAFAIYAVSGATVLLGAVVAAALVLT